MAPCAPLANEHVVTGMVFLKGGCQSVRQAFSVIIHSDVQTQEARNDKYDDHDADDVENIHCALRFRLCDFNVKQRFHPSNKHGWRSEVP